VFVFFVKTLDIKAEEEEEEEDYFSFFRSLMKFRYRTGPLPFLWTI